MEIVIFTFSTDTDIILASVQPYIGTALPQNFNYLVKKNEEICNLSVISSGTPHLGHPADYII